MLLAGCSQVRGRIDARGAGQPDVAYNLRLLDSEPRGVAVTVTACGADDGRTVFALSEEWGGIKADDGDIADLEVHGAGDRSLSVEHPKPFQWVVKHAPRELLTLRYVLRPPADRPPLPRGNDYRTMLTGNLFHMFGNHGLPVPEHEQDDRPRQVRLSWEGFEEAGWRIASSHGVGSGPFNVAMPLDRFRHALFMAGEIRCYDRDIHGRRLGMAVYGRDWKFKDEEFVDLVERIVRAEREFFDDHSDPWYLVSIIPTGDGNPRSVSLGGTAVTHGFALFVTPNVGFASGEPGGDRVKWLLAHEYFHRWNGGRYDLAEPEQRGYWFSEGFTDYYARRLLLRAGMLSAAEYAADLNESIRNYWLNPMRSSANSAIVEGFWSNEHAGNLPYRRGDLVALTLDEAIRAKSGGKRCLDDFMRELLATEPKERTKMDNAEFFARFKEWAGGETSEEVRRVVEDGADLALPATLSDPPMVRDTRQVYAFDVGFDEAASRESKAVAGVRADGPAYAAGLRDGQRLVGYSLMYGRADHQAEFTVEENGARKKITYYPRGAAMEVPAYRQP